jgi:RecA/RadA recombinase
MKATKAAQLLRKAGVIAPNAPILFVFDSIAAALPQSQAEKEIDQYTMNDTTALARVTSSTLKTQAYWAGELNATFLYLNQTRTKPGVVYGDPTTTPGGKSMEFYASARVALSRSKIMENAAGGKEFTGQNVGAKVVKSKFTKPFQEVDLRLTFDEMGVAHFDYNFTLIEYLIAEGKLEYSKPRVTWIDGKKFFIKELAEKIRTEGLEDQLRSLLFSAAA